MRVTLLTGCAAVAACLASTGCRHRDFWYLDPDDYPRARVEIRARYVRDWEVPAPGQEGWQSRWPAGTGLEYDSLRPAPASGLRMLLYDMAPDGTGLAARYLYNLEGWGGEAEFPPGPHGMMIYNNDTEYLRFERMDSWELATATTRRVERKGASAVDGEPTIGAPDVLYACTDTRVEVPVADTLQVMDVEMRPLVFTYVVVYRFDEGMQLVQAARGSLSGMARGVGVCTGQRSSERATVLYECQVRGQDDCVVAAVRSFGTPTGSEGTHLLGLDVMLRSGRMASFQWDVGAQVAAQPQGGVIQVGGVKVKEDDGQEHPGGFEAEVNEWGPWQDVVIDF